MTNADTHPTRMINRGRRPEIKPLDWGVPRPKPCWCEGLPTPPSSLIRLDDLRRRPATAEINPDAVMQCGECGQFWHASDGWWRPISDRQARRIHRRNIKTRRRSVQP